MGSMARTVATAGRLLLLSLALAWPLGCDTTAAPTPVATAPPPEPSPALAAGATPVPSPTTPPTVRLDVMAGASTPPEAPYHFRVEVPRLDGLPLRDQPMNAFMRSTLQHDVDEFLDTARDAPAGPPASDLTCRSRSVRVTARIAALRVDCTEYYAGAAHPNTFTHTFNCDLAGARVLALQDLFGPGSSYLGVLSNAARTQLRGRLAASDEQTLDAGTAPVADNFRAFLLGASALVIVFGKYQVAPGASGQPEVSVTYDAIQRYLAPGMPALLTG